MRLLSRQALAYELRHWPSGAAGAHVVCAAGELDLQAAPELRTLMCRLIDLRVTDFVVDLTRATFIDSTTIGVLSGRLKQVRALGGSLVLVCTDEFLLRTFEIAGMNRVFEIYPTLPEGLARGRS
jgi:anti-sigma B factor antagonist